MDRRIALATLGSLAAAGTLPAWAQERFPSRTMRVIVGYPAGGVTDIAARVVADLLAKKYKQAVVVENRPGASGVIGQQIVASAPPDGYTLSSGGLGSNVIPPATVEGLPLDIVKSLVPVAQTAEFVNVLVVRRDHPANNVAEFIARAKASSKPVLYGANGIGSSAHLTTAFFGLRTGVKTEIVSYKGAGELLIDVANGGLEMAFANLPSVLALVRDGRLKPLAVTSTTMQESGVPDFNVTSWLGMYATAGTPRPIVEQLGRDIVQGLELPEFKGRLESAGFEVRPKNAPEFEEFTRHELEKWGGVARQLALKLQYGKA
jgi:tripartite-type tricarboxylate transporter receptor subunit TctC